MNFLSLEYFLAIVKTGNISKAANKVFVSQQSLSEHIARLEKEIGTSLLNRGRRIRQITPTTAGKRFMDCAEKILKERDSMLSDVQDIIKSKEYTIKFGIATFEAPPFLPNFLIQFGEAYPNCNVTVYPLKDISLSGLSGVDIDLILRDIDLDGPIQSLETEWETEYLYHNNKYAVIAKKSLLLETYGDQWPSIEKKLIAEKDLYNLRNLPFLSVRDKNNIYSHLLKKVFKYAEVDPNIKFQVDMNYIINEMCAKGVAAYLGPERLCKFKFDVFIKESDDMCMYTVEIPGIRHGLAISFKKEKGLTNVQREFIEMCREIVNH